jgi:hypothetical protein
METKILKVVKSGELFTVKSEKTEGGVLSKRNLVLSELGKFEDKFMATALGDNAELELKEGDIVAVSMRFSCRDYNGQTFQDITINEIYKLNVEQPKEVKTF